MQSHPSFFWECHKKTARTPEFSSSAGATSVAIFDFQKRSFPGSELVMDFKHDLWIYIPEGEA